MRRTKKWLSILLVLMLALAMVGCGGDEPVEEEPMDDPGEGEPAVDPVELKLGHIQTESDFWHLGAIKFGEALEELSDGAITLAIFPNSTMGGDRDMAEQLQLGSLDFALIAGVLSNFESTISLLELPYLFDNQDEYNTIIYGDVGAEIEQNVLDASGIRIISWWDRGPREVTSNKPIETLADVKGLKMRLPEINAMVVTWTAMGAAPTAMAWSEVYTGLQQGVIDAQENPVPYIYGASIQEVQTHIAMTDHKYEYVTIAMSDKTWQTLSPEQQAIIEEAAAIATEYENDLVAEQTESILQMMVDEGMTVTYPDKEEFAAAARAAHADYAESIDCTDLYNKIMEELGR